MLAAAEPSRPALSDMLREGTRDAHRAAERGPFVRAFLRGQLDRDTYVRMLGGLLRVYAALEDGLLRRRGHPLVAPFVLPALFRAPALAVDLAHFLGPAWQSRLAPSPAAERYAAHLDRLAADAPPGLVAHAYTRYLGDLSGGRLLRDRAARALGLSEGPGLAFYDFPAIPDIAAFKADFRARLDALPLTDAAAAALVDEANFAFAASAALFAELA